MDERKDGLRREEQQVIQEQILPKKKKNWKKFGKSLLRLATTAVGFGIIAGITLVVTGNFLIKKFGLEKVLRQAVDVGKVTQMVSPTGVPSQSQTPVATKSPTSVEMPGFDADPSITTPQVMVTIGGNKTEGKEEVVIDDETVQGFLNMYTSIADLSGKFSKSLVHITAISEGVDWFEEAYETSRNATGLYVGNNGLDMLFLASFDSIEGATRFQVTFSNGTTLPCSVFSYDTNYCLAILSVRLSAAASVEEDSWPEKAEFAMEGLEPGTPVVVLGNPNGHPGAIELGMTTGTGLTVQVTDDEVRYFTTGITEYAEGDGFVFNLSGEVIGMLSNTLNKGEQGIITAVEVGDLRDVINATLNNIPRMYCGLHLETVNTVMGGKYSLPEGIYVSEVLPGSPAMYAGIKNGDIITEVGITPVTSVRQFYEEITDVGAHSVRIIVSRDVKGERKEQTLYMVPELRYH